MPGLDKVDYYTRCTGSVTVYFPEDKVRCQWCPFCRNEDSLKRWKCLITGEYIVYPFAGVGNQCPLIPEE